MDFEFTFNVYIIIHFPIPCFFILEGSLLPFSNQIYLILKIINIAISSPGYTSRSFFKMSIYLQQTSAIMYAFICNVHFINSVWIFLFYPRIRVLNFLKPNTIYIFLCSFSLYTPEIICVIYLSLLIVYLG